MSDVIKITILADGTIRTETDSISAPNHQSADAFLRDVAILTGGEVKRESKARTQGATVSRTVAQG
jgi:hypothetical protein